MRETNGPNDGLALQAFLYASGELDADEAAAFEQRLSDDQSAREALTQAVQLTRAPSGLVPLRPTPAYRAAVLRRLRPQPFDWLLRRRSYRGHPGVWTGIGAAAAVLLTLHLYPTPTVSPAPEPETAVRTVAPSPPPNPLPVDVEPELMEADVAEVWAELNNTDHIARAHEEEMRRRTRVEERSRMMRGEDHRSRVLHNTSSRR